MDKLFRLYGIRGAAGAKNTENDICRAVTLLCSKLFKKNNLIPENIVSVQFTSTSDLTACNPAKALRLSKIDFDCSKLPLFCSAEPEIDGAPLGIIRILVTAYMQNPPIHVYTSGAEILRPDFCASKEEI